MLGAGEASRLEKEEVDVDVLDRSRVRSGCSVVMSRSRSMTGMRSIWPPMRLGM